MLSRCFHRFPQGLLKKVYQESCRILTLSQRRPTASSQLGAQDVKLSSQTQYHAGDGAALLDHGDKPSSNPPMSWQQEKRALQETVIALREMLCRMAQRQPQVSIVLGNFRSHILTLLRQNYIFLCLLCNKKKTKIKNIYFFLSIRRVTEVKMVGTGSRLNHS